MCKIIPRLFELEENESRDRMRLGSGDNKRILTTPTIPQLSGRIRETDLARSRIFVGQLLPTVTTQMLVALFSRVGKVLSTSVHPLKPGKSFASAFVQYEYREDAERAIDIFNVRF